METEAIAKLRVSRHYYRFPKSVIARFTFKRTLKSASIWAVIFGMYMAEKTLAYAKAYPTHASRLKIASSFSNNVGLKILLGQPHHLDTVSGFANWNTLGLLSIISSIWAFLLATRYFRGEEENDRTEILLSGQTTKTQATVNTLKGLFGSIFVLFLVTCILFIALGSNKNLNFSAGSSAFFALACISGAAIFMPIGALTSQLMQSRTKATGLAVGIFAVFFLLRAVADITTLHWLSDLTPFGWIEKLNPLFSSKPLWLLPIFGFSLATCTLCVYLAGKRDLGTGIIKPKDHARANSRFLNGTLGSAFRLNGMVGLAWLVGVFLVSGFYGLLTKSAAQAFSGTHGIQNAIDKLERTSRIQAATLYMGIVFFLMMSLIMAYVANQNNKIREEEANGYLDNFLVRPLSRTKWLNSHVLYILLSSLAMCPLVFVGVFIGQASQHNGVGQGILFESSINMLAPVLFVLGLGVFIFGLKPRLTSFVSYGYIGWSFLIFMIGSGLNLNHWLLDTSVLHQVTLSPATKPNWSVDILIVVVSLALYLIGLIAFKTRDIETD